MLDKTVMQQLRVDFITNQAPHYRSALWKRLCENAEIDAIFLFGEGHSDQIKTIDFSEPQWADKKYKLRRLKNLYVKNVLLWQHGVLKHVWDTDAEAVVFLGDMYIISTWIAVWLARCRGIVVLFWGHGLYGAESRLKNWFRTRFLRLANCNLVYGKHARGLLIQSGLPSNFIRVVYNSLEYAHQLAIRETVIQADFFSSQGWFDDPSAPTLLFVGRLTPEKRLACLIDAVKSLRGQGQIFNLLIVGDGADTQRLRTLAADLIGQVHFYGASYREEELGRLIANSDLCVSPGNVGLTAMHALGYGTPVCTHSDLTRQMPEAESVIEGRTGVFFDYVDMNIAEAICRWFASAPNRDSIRAFCYEEIDTKWNTENQVNIIVKAIREFVS
jgi:glycosyltransferase involved in cell wall biosynthesis